MSVNTTGLVGSPSRPSLCLVFPQSSTTALWELVEFEVVDVVIVAQVVVGMVESLLLLLVQSVTVT